MSIANISKLQFDVEMLAKEAGQAIMEIYNRDVKVVYKIDKSPVTEADNIAHHIIVKALFRLTPEIPILSEEAVSQFDSPNKNGQYWLVDPLDGTKEFIKKNEEFTVNIALIEQGKSILGVVYAPALETLYSASIEKGATKTDASGKVTAIQVSSRKPGTPWKVVGSRSHGGNMTVLLEKLGVYEVVSIGSSLKFCMVAEGVSHIYPRFGTTSLWDTAAAQCIVEMAGGSVKSIDGKSLNYSHSSCNKNSFFCGFG